MTAGQDFAAQHGGAGVAAGATEGVACGDVGVAGCRLVVATVAVGPGVVDAPPVDPEPDDCGSDDCGPDDSGPDDCGSEADVPGEDAGGAPVADGSGTDDGGSFVTAADGRAGELIAEDTGTEAAEDTGAGTAVGVPAVCDEQPASARANATATDTSTDV